MRSVPVPASHYNSLMNITLPELENVINYWRTQRPASGEECALSPEVNALASVYAKMIFYCVASVRLEELDPATQQLVQTWQQHERNRQNAVPQR